MKMRGFQGKLGLIIIPKISGESWGSSTVPLNLTSYSCSQKRWAVALTLESKFLHAMSFKCG